MHAQPREEEGSHAVRFESDSGVPLHCCQARAGRQVWAGLAQIRRPGLTTFFSVNQFLVFANPCKFENP
jgi:hypothetical protein